MKEYAFPTCYLIFKELYFRFTVSTISLEHTAFCSASPKGRKFFRVLFSKKILHGGAWCVRFQHSIRETVGSTFENQSQENSHSCTG